MKTKRRRSQPSGFTLVELLTVIAMIVVLAGLSVIAVGAVTRFAAVKRAETQIALLDSGLFRYEADTGTFPVARDPNGIAMYCALFGDGVGPDGIRGTADDGPLDGKRDEGAKTYLSELDPATNPLGLLEGPVGGVPTRMVDPFGNSWQYTSGAAFSPVMNNTDFDIYSPGPNGRGSAESPDADDLHNW